MADFGRKDNYEENDNFLGKLFLFTSILFHLVSLMGLILGTSNPDSMGVMILVYLVINGVLVIAWYFYLHGHKDFVLGVFVIGLIIFGIVDFSSRVAKEQASKRRAETYHSTLSSGKSKYGNSSSGYSLRSGTSNYHYSSGNSGSYDSAEEYAEDNVEEYLDSGDYDDYDEAYEAAMDDYEYDHDY